MKIDLENLTVKMSKDSFHYKLMKLVLGEQMPNLNSLCPYFWLFWFCLITGSVILFVKGFIWVVEKFINGIDKLFFEGPYIKWVNSLTEKDMYELYYGYVKPKFRIKSNFSTKYETFKSYKEKNNISDTNFYSMLDIGRDEYNSKKDLSNKEKEIFRAKLKKITTCNSCISSINFNKIILWTKRILTVFFTIIVGIILIVCSIFIFYLIKKITMEFIMGFLLAIGYIALIALSIFISVIIVKTTSNYIVNNLERKTLFTKIWMGFAEVIIIPFKWLWCILCWIYKIIKSPFVFCYDYFKATKNDYCPGIIWDDEK